jgi:LysM repeat protein
MRTNRVITLLLLSIGLLAFSSILTAQEATSEATAETTASVTPTTPVPSATTPVPSATTPAPGSQTYVVKAGDTLFRIATNFKVSVQALAAANAISNPNRILAGQTLVIPSTTATPVPTVTVSASPATTTATVTATATTPATPAPGTTTYVVARGDTLFSIAVRFRTTVAELQRVNNISNINLIFSGQRLTIPAPGSTSAGTGTSAGGTGSTGTSGSGTGANAALFAPQNIANNGFGRGIEVFIEGQDVNALTQQATLLGVKWVKITVNWRKIEPTKGTPNFTELDSAVNAFNQAGISVMLTLTGAPDWSRPTLTDVAKGLNEYGPPDALADFGTFAGSVATRYKGKVQAYEIWTEPNLRRTWLEPNVKLIEVTQPNGTKTQVPDARMSNLRYFDLFKAGRDAIKAADAAALVITAGLAPTGYNDRVNAIDDAVFLGALIDQGILPLADAIGAQPDGFANPPDAACCAQSPGVSTHFDNNKFYFINTLNNYRQLLNAKGGSSEVIWVTRFGWGTGEGNTLLAPSQNSIYLTYTSPAEQATYVTRAYEIGQQLGYVGPMFLFNLNGCQANNGEACFYSMVDSAKAARPVFVALQNVAKPVTTPAPESTAEVIAPVLPEATAEATVAADG